VEIEYGSDVSLPCCDTLVMYWPQFIESKLCLLAFRRVTGRASSELGSDKSMESSHGEMTSVSYTLYILYQL
jgi:hypothetical protein